MYTTHRTGGGCGAGRPIIGRNESERRSSGLNFKEMLEKLEKQREQNERAHAAWLLTPAGIEHTKKLEEEKRIKEEEERQIQIENEKHDSWLRRFDALRTNPDVGTVLDLKQMYTLRAQENPNKPGMISIYALLRVEGSYPSSEPHRVLQLRGKAGLKIFVNGASRKWLETQFHQEFKSLWLEIDKLRRELEEERAAAKATAEAGGIYEPDYREDYAYEYSRREPYVPTATMEINLPIRIIGYAASGKSAIGELITK